MAQMIVSDEAARTVGAMKDHWVAPKAIADSSACFRRVLTKSRARGSGQIELSPFQGLWMLKCPVWPSDMSWA
jgi:hypothetical protein